MNGSVRSTDGTAIAWEQTGDGPPLVLVHGTTADRTRWAGVVGPLAERFTVYAVDRRGRGLSGDGDAYAIEREFEDIAAVVDAIEGPVNLLGHSYGALCSLEAATRTSNIGKLVLYEPPIPVGVQIVPDEVLARIDALVEADERDTALRTFFTEVVQMTVAELEMVSSLPSWRARVAAAHTLARETRVERDWRPNHGHFEKISVPTLLLEGSESPPFLHEAIRLLEKTIPGVRTVVFEGQAHVAMDSAPELFVREVVSFLQG
jgi:pimeloyl-ACP methyl ester carboxylesterase